LRGCRERELEGLRKDSIVVDRRQDAVEEILLVSTDEPGTLIAIAEINAIEVGASPTQRNTKRER
jgi:hypothetical protein